MEHQITPEHRPVHDAEAKGRSGGELVVLESSNAYVLEQSEAVDIDQRTVIHHGDQVEPFITCKLVGLESKSTEKAKHIPKPWKDGMLSQDYLAKVCEVGQQEVSENSLKRVALADQDAQNLHRARSQKGSNIAHFQSIIDNLQGGVAEEKVVCELSCKGILNVNFSAKNPRDIVGDCKIVLTNLIVDGKPHRRIYFAQMGFETKVAGSVETSKKIEKVVNTTRESETDVAMSRTRERTMHEMTNTYREAEIEVTCARETVSVMEVLDVEEQLVQVFAEQLDRTKLSTHINYAGREVRERTMREEDAVALPRSHTEVTVQPGEAGFFCCANCKLPQCCTCCKLKCCDLKCPKCCDPKCCKIKCCDLKCPKCPTCSCNCLFGWCMSCYRPGRAGTVTVRTTGGHPPPRKAKVTVKHSHKESDGRFRVEATTVILPDQLVMSHHVLVTDRKTGSEMFRVKDDQVGEDERIKTTATTTNFTALYFQYFTPSCSEMQESVALIATDQPLSEVFRFAAVASRVPNQRGRVCARYPLPNPTVEQVARVERVRERRRDKLREMALEMEDPVKSPQGMLTEEPEEEEEDVVMAALRGVGIGQETNEEEEEEEEGEEGNRVAGGGGGGGGQGEPQDPNQAAPAKAATASLGSKKKSPKAGGAGAGGAGGEAKGLAMQADVVAAAGVGGRPGPV